MHHEALPDQVTRMECLKLSQAMAATLSGGGSRTEGETARILARAEAYADFVMNAKAAE